MSDIDSVLKEKHWRVELFWNGGGNWFTARLVSPFDRFGNRVHPTLMPFEDPIGAGGATPQEAMANLEIALMRFAE